MKKRRFPPEKKRLSYERDRRNVYGENDKASRRNIPKTKALAKRSDRRRARTAIDSSDVTDPDRLEARVRSIRRRPAWKMPDEPLGQVVEEKLERRAARDRRRKGSTPRS